MGTLRRLWPLPLLLGAFVLAKALDLQRFASLEALSHDRLALQAWVAAHPILSPAAYLALYVTLVGVSLPGATMLTVVGGLLFGTLYGTAYAVLGATVGGVVFFLLARYALADWLAARAGPVLVRLRTGLQRDGFFYLLAVRLLPLVPFWLANLAPALAGMRLLPFAVATLLGITPATAVVASLGAGLGAALQQGGTPELALDPAILLPLAGLSLLALVPIAYRRWRRL